MQNQAVRKDLSNKRRIANRLVGLEKQRPVGSQQPVGGAEVTHAAAQRRHCQFELKRKAENETGPPPS